MRELRAHEGTFVSGWGVNRVWGLSLALCAGFFLVGLLAAGSADLAGLLVVGPCCALLTGRWVRTGITALLAVCLAAMVTLVAGGGESEEFAFVAAVGLVGAVNTLAAAWLERRIDRQIRSERF